MGFEKLLVFQLTLEFRKLCMDVCPKRGHGDLRDQLDRASASAVLNLAEGAGRFHPRDKARFYDIARGSTTESVAVLAVVEASGGLGRRLESRLPAGSRPGRENCPHAHEALPEPLPPKRCVSRVSLQTTRMRRPRISS